MGCISFSEGRIGYKEQEAININNKEEFIMENKKIQPMDLDEMDKVSGGTTQEVSQGDLDILKSKVLKDVMKPKKDNNNAPGLGGEDPTIIGDPTQNGFWK